MRVTIRNWYYFRNHSPQIIFYYCKYSVVFHMSHNLLSIMKDTEMSNGNFQRIFNPLIRFSIIYTKYVGFVSQE